MRNDGYEDLNLGALLREAWAAKVFWGVGLALGCLAAFVIMVFSNPQYEARMMIGPAQPMEMSMQTRYEDGRSAYVLGQNQGSVSEKVSNFVKFDAIRGGVSVAGLLLRDSRVAEGLSTDQRFLHQAVREDAFQANELVEYIRKRVHIDPHGESALREMVYRHRDGAFAAYFVQQIHRISDQLIRAELRAQVDERIDYLERAIAKINNPEQRRVMTNLLLEQERNKMMVSMDSPVAAAVVEPAVISSKPVSPDAYLLYGGLGLFGALVGFMIFGAIHVPVAQQGERHDAKPMQRGDDLQHKPKRPLKYGSWFNNVPDNANDIGESRLGSSSVGRGERSDAAE